MFMKNMFGGPGVFEFLTANGEFGVAWNPFFPDQPRVVTSNVLPSATFSFLKAIGNTREQLTALAAHPLQYIGLRASEAQTANGYLMPRDPQDQDACWRATYFVGGKPGEHGLYGLRTATGADSANDHGWAPERNQSNED